MSKSIFLKILICTIFAVLMFAFDMQTSYALGDIFEDGKMFLEEANSISDTINTTALEETSDTIYNTLLAIGIMVAIIVAMVLGIQFMAASADEKAKVKEAFMPYIVGCFVVFGSFTIWKVVVNIGNNANDSIEFGFTYKYCYACGKSSNTNNPICECGNDLTRTTSDLLNDCHKYCSECGSDEVYYSKNDWFCDDCGTEVHYEEYSVFDSNRVITSADKWEKKYGNFEDIPYFVEFDCGLYERFCKVNYCRYCHKKVGKIPDTIITGGRNYECPNCYKIIVENGQITGINKRIK